MLSRSSDARWGRPDPLSSVLLDLGLRGTFFCRAELHAPWALDVPERDFSSFHYVSSGRARLTSARVDERAFAPQVLEAGDLAFVPPGRRHTLVSFGPQRAPRAEKLPAQPLTTVATIVRRGGDGPRAVLVCGGVQVGALAGKMLVASLPPIIVLRAADAHPIVRSALEAMHYEADSPRPGGTTVMTRLADVVVVHALRRYLSDSPARGWLAALQDPQVGRAIAAVHARPEARWTLPALAREARLSRSRFAERFFERVGEAPMHYVAGVRMQRALEVLAEGQVTIDELAQRFGYDSGPAFARAFKRHTGVTPGAARRSAIGTRGRLLQRR
jgi:AraC-like DNA-binding protein